MQLIQTLVAATAIVVCAASCKKETISNPAPTPAPPPAAEKRIVQEKNLTNGDLRKYSYDAQGKVVKVESSTHSWSIEYMPSMIKVARQRITDGLLQGAEEYTIDASGKMTSSVSKSAAGVINYTYEYEYDAAGYMIRMKEIYANGEMYEDFVTNPAGNPVTVKNYYNGVLNDVTDYYYNANVKNMGLGTVLLTTYGIRGFAGKVPEREISELKRYNGYGTLFSHKVSTFTADTHGNILKSKVVYPLSGLTHDIDITYQ